MIRVDRANCRVDFGISLRGLRHFLACLFAKRPRVIDGRVVRVVRVEKVLECPLDRVNCRVDGCGQNLGLGPWAHGPPYELPPRFCPHPSNLRFIDVYYSGGISVVLRHNFFFVCEIQNNTSSLLTQPLVLSSQNDPPRNTNLFLSRARGILTSGLG